MIKRLLSHFFKTKKKSAAIKKTFGIWMFLLIGGLVFPVVIQSQEGAIFGIVRSPGGKPLTDISVSISGNQTHNVRRLNTDRYGRYEFKSLPIGVYNVKAGSPGYEDVEVKDIVLTAQANREVNIVFTMVPGVIRESIVVSARIIEENLQDAPLSIMALNTDQLFKMQADKLDNLTQYAPNVNIFTPRSSTSNGAVFIRGIGQEDTVFTVDSGVGIYVDDVLLPRSQASIMDIYDIERIEILRGPQGTLYGRNTIGGAIKLISKQPTNELSGAVDITTGNYNLADIKGNFNLPILHDRLVALISAGTFNRRGFETNTFTGKRTYSKRSIVGRGALLWTPNKNLNIEFRADVLRDRPSIRVGALLRPQTTALDYPGLLNGDLVTFPANKDKPFSVRSDVQDKQAVDTWGASGTIAWRLSDNLSLKSVTGYRSLSSDIRIDLDATEARAIDAFAIQDHQQASQEVQFTHRVADRWSTVGGLFFFYENDHQLDGTDASAKGFSLDATYRQKTLSYAVYAQTGYSFTNRLSISGGMRYTFENKRFSRQAEQHQANPNAPDYNLFGGFGHGPGAIPPDSFPGNGRRLTDIRGAYGDWSAFTPRLGVEYRWSQDVMSYASVSRGFKSGGFNGRANEASNPDQRAPYNPEYAWTYELGTKTSWFNRQLFLNLDLFYNNYTDLQLASFSTPDNGQTYLPLFTNAGKAVTRGLEFELSAYPFPGLEMYGSLGFTDAKFKEYIERGVDVSHLRTLANTPKWTATFSTSYSISISNRNHRLQIGGDINYQGKRFLTVSNLPDLLQSDYIVANAFITFQTHNQRWRISLGCKNLADERYMVAGLDASSRPFSVVTGFFGDPRTWNLTLSARF